MTSNKSKRSMLDDLKDGLECMLMLPLAMQVIYDYFHARIKRLGRK